MFKRPLCVVALAIVMILIMLDKTGASTLQKPMQILQERAEQGVACQIEGNVRYYERKPKSIYIYLKDTILSVQSEQYSIKETIIKYDGKTDYFSMGNNLRISGKLEALPKATNPGQFDAGNFYNARNIYFFVKGEKLQIIDEDYDWLKGTLYHFREQFCEKINILEPQGSGILNAMLTGEKMFLEEEDKIRYQMSGIYHIISVSGCHFAAVWAGLCWLLGKARLNYYVSAMIAAALMVVFGIFVGDNIPAMRALIMILVYVGARFTGRTYDMLSAMSLSAVLILAQFPGLLYDGGFQLSFGAIIALGAVYPVIKGDDEKKAKTKVQKMLNSLKGGFAAGLAIWLVTLPITLYAFYEVSLWGVVLNLLVVPTSSIVLASGMLGGVSAFANMTIANILILPARVLLNIYDGAGKIIQRIPYATLVLGQPKIWQCVVYYLVLITFLVGWSYKKKKCRVDVRIVSLALGIVLTIFLGFRTYSQLRITALDVGQGDSLVIELPTGSHYLVDGGSSNQNKVGTYRIMPYLKSQGIATLQAVMVTHPDSDHLNGIIEMLEAIKNYQTSIRIRRFILPAWMAEDKDAKELRDLLAETNIPAVYVKANDSITDGEVFFDILNPSKPEYEDANEGSLTFVLKYKDFAGVFTGDLCGGAEKHVTSQITECDFLKVSHHGSKNSTPKDFLEKANPKLSVISCGASNPYGHPHEELLERLSEAQSEIYSTAKGGAITLKTKGKDSIEVSTYSGGE